MEAGLILRLHGTLQREPWRRAQTDEDGEGGVWLTGGRRTLGPAPEGAKSHGRKKGPQVAEAAVSTVGSETPSVLGADGKMALCPGGPGGAEPVVVRKDFRRPAACWVTGAVAFAWDLSAAFTFLSAFLLPPLASSRLRQVAGQGPGTPDTRRFRMPPWSGTGLPGECRV